MDLQGSFAASRTPMMVLIVLLVIGASTRLYGLEVQSLWNDELSHWGKSNHPTVSQVIEKGAKRDRHPLGYRLLLHGVIRHLGDSPTLLRLPSALAGILSIGLIFWLGLALFSWREGLLAAGLLTGSWTALFYGQEATPYSVLLMLSMLSFLAAWKLAMQLQGGSMPAAMAVVYVLTAAVTCHTHYYGVLLIGLQLAGLALITLKQPRKLAVVMTCALAIALLFAPWVPFLLDQLAIERSGGFPDPNLLLAWQVMVFLNHGSVVAAVAALILLAYVVVSRTHGDQPAAILAKQALLAWLLLPSLLLFAVALLYKPMLADRHFMIVLPAMVLLLARALALLIPGRWVPLAALALCAALLAELVLSRDYYSRLTRQQFRQAAVLMDQYARQHPGALVLAYAWSGSYLNYYLERLGSESRVRHAGLGHERQLPQVDRLIDRADPKQIIYVSAHRRPRLAFLQGLEQRATLLQEHILLGATVRLYERPGE